MHIQNIRRICGQFMSPISKSPRDCRVGKRPDAHTGSRLHPGPRLHHAAYFVRKPDDILRACDLVGELGLPMLTCKEGSGRHGMDGAYYIYFRDPDGHRVELFDGHYQTIDTELEPKQYAPQIAAPPWGLPALASRFHEGTPFIGTELLPPGTKRYAPTMEQFVRGE